MKRYIFAALAIALVACTPESNQTEDDSPVEELDPATVLSVSPRECSSPNPGTLFEFSVSTDAQKWTADVNCDWLIEQSRDGDKIVFQLDPKSLDLYNDRVGKIEFKAGDLKYACKVTYKKALILDVEFQEDGSAKDLSGNGYKVEQKGNDGLLTYYSEEAGKYVARFGHNAGDDISSGYYKFDYSSLTNVQSALKDGYALEALVMYDSEPIGKECKAFSSTESGGMALMVANSNYLNQFAYIANNGNWIFNCGLTPKRGRYYHLVGVYDQIEESTVFYVDGVKKSSSKCAGEIKLPSSKSYYWFGIGADPGSVPQAAWRGDVVFARIYDATLNEDNVKSLYEASKAASIGDFNVGIDGIGLLSYCTTAPGRLFTIAGTGFKSGDKVEPVRSDGVSVGALDLEVFEDRVKLVIPSGMTSGNYTFLLRRGNSLVYPLGACEITISDDIPSDWRPEAIAHRGFHRKETENSLGALRAALNLGVYGSEIDFYITTDDSLMVHHDGVLGGKRIDQNTYSYARSFKLSNGEPIPTVWECLNIIKSSDSRTKLIIEIKDHSSQDRENLAVDRLLEMVYGLGLQDKVEYIAFDYESCKRVVAAHPDAVVAYLSGDRAPSELHADGIKNIDYSYGILFTNKKQWIAECHALGMGVNVWTVNNDADLMKAMSLGCDYISTDYPDRLIELIDMFF